MARHWARLLAQLPRLQSVDLVHQPRFKTRHFFVVNHVFLGRFIQLPSSIGHQCQSLFRITRGDGCIYHLQCPANFPFDVTIAQPLAIRTTNMFLG